MSLTISIKNLYKSFGDKEVIKGIDLDVKEGASLVILGESGTGKSVLLRLLGLQDEPSSGSLKYNNIETFKLEEKYKNKIISKIGFLFQNCGLFDNLSIIENVCFLDLFIKNNTKIEKKIAIEKASEKLEYLGVKSLNFHLKPGQISGGMQKRVAIARILTTEPDLILLDEPTSGLDPITSDIVNDTILLMKSATNANVITITHDLHSATKIADTICILKNGSFIWKDEPKKIFDTNIEYIDRFIEASNVKK